MVRLIDLLLDHGFGVVLTSDHGNIEAVGIGRPSEGAVADLRGERVRVYPDRILRTRIKTQFPNAIEWPPLGLPEDYLPLIAPNRDAFIREGERIVAHGGISLEEVIVPSFASSGGPNERVYPDWLQSAHSAWLARADGVTTLNGTYAG